MEFSVYHIENYEVLMLHVHYLNNTDLPKNRIEKTKCRYWKGRHQMDTKYPEL